MRKLWLTYAWKDNEDKNVDFIIKELDGTDLEVRFDRRNLIVGQRLWSQIAQYITDPVKCDAWGILLTPNSLRSEACLEELSYALDRVLDSRTTMPMFALMHNIKSADIPKSLKVRLCISLSDPNWVAQVVDASHGKATGFLPDPNLSPIVAKVYPMAEGLMLELRPRFETIAPLMVVIETTDYEAGNIKSIIPETPAGHYPTGGMVMLAAEDYLFLNDYPSPGHQYKAYGWQFSHTNDPQRSTMIHVGDLPKRVWYGAPGKLAEIETASLVTGKWPDR